nr:argininosuccinate lyase [Roseivivax sp. GX 12232]
MALSLLALAACGADGAPERPDPDPEPRRGISVSGSVETGVAVR